MPISAITSLASPVASAIEKATQQQARPAELSVDGMQNAMRAGKAAPDQDAEGPSASSFAHYLDNAVSEVNKAQLHAGDMTARFAAGAPIDVHQVMIAAQEASVALNLAIQVRNKLVDAYQEVMKVNV